MEQTNLRRTCAALAALVVALSIAVTGLSVALIVRGEAAPGAGGLAFFESAHAQLPPPKRGSGDGSDYFVELTGDGTAALLFERQGDRLTCLGVCILGGRKLPDGERRWAWQGFKEAK